MINIVDKKDCCGCTSCYSICPKNCIDMIEDNEGFVYPYINKSECIGCNMCEKRCPILQERRSAQTDVYGCYTKDDDIRSNSSSGGIFSLLVNSVIKEDGIVYGAMFDNENNVIHDSICKYEEVNKLRGSKYVQSQVKGIFSKIKQDLMNNKPILFSGTPCQVAGLKDYLGKEYDKLICVDIVCHGVPSPMIYRDYIKFLENRFQAKVSNINFRDKSNGWDNYYIKITFENGQELKELASKNTYMKGFLADLYIRPSCEDCRFKNFKSGSDITLGDFWGIQNIDEYFYSDKGVSSICINSKKGKELFNTIDNSKIEIKKYELDDIVKYNPCIVKSTRIHQFKNKFYDKYNGNNLNKLVKKYTNPPIRQVIKNNIYRYGSLIKRNIYKLLGNE